jgi:hypothetical protein
MLLLLTHVSHDHQTAVTKVGRLESESLRLQSVDIETGSKTKLGLAARTADQMPPRLYFKGIARQGGAPILYSEHSVAQD